MQKFAEKLKMLWKNPAMQLLAGCLAILLCGVGLVYYWRVFYSFDLLGAGKTTLLAVAGLGLLTAAAVLILRANRSFAAKALALLLVSGTVMAFANPPLQVPDEASHFLRAYSMASGQFDFVPERGYPDDVDALHEAFTSGFVNSQDGRAIYTDENGVRRSMATCFARYETLKAEGTAPALTEPINFFTPGYLPQAAGIALCRLFGGDALACLYAARLANLLVYGLLVFAALRRCRAFAPVLAGIAVLPLTLFVSASASYDALLTGLTLFAVSALCKAQLTRRDLLLYGGCVAFLSVIKPNNLLLLLLLLAVPTARLCVRHARLWLAGLSVGGYFLLNALYGLWIRGMNHFPALDRWNPDVSIGRQIAFVLANPLRYAAVLLGTFYENDGFVSGLGNFGYLDLAIPAVTLMSLALLVCLAVNCRGQAHRLTAGTSWMLGLFVLGFTVVTMTAMYVTWTPVGMVRIIGLQARYFLPALLVLCILAGSWHAHRNEPRTDLPTKTGTGTLLLGYAIACASALLIFQHYYIGPVV